MPKSLADLPPFPRSPIDPFLQRKGLPRREIARQLSVSMRAVAYFWTEECGQCRKHWDEGYDVILGEDARG